MNKRRVLVTGGAGFIGSAFIRYSLNMEGIAKPQFRPKFALSLPDSDFSQTAYDQKDMSVCEKHESALKSSNLGREASFAIPSTCLICEKIVNLDLLTYAGDLKNVRQVENDSRYVFVQGDIADEALVEKLCRQYEIDTIVHFAAESHVDRSIEGPRAFFETNVRGTFSLLEVVRRLPYLHFHHVSTDEVYGSLSETGMFSEISSYRPSSPYAASKAASDHFVMAYAHTYGLSITLSHCTNNYGPYQFPEKFIPLMILNCLQGKTLPVYGSGLNVRDWLYVDDHAEALWSILTKGQKGEIYDIGGECEKRNIDLLHMLIDLLALSVGEESEKYRSLIAFVTDRPGHDLRYAIDCTKIKRQLGWAPRHALEDGLKKTIHHYINEEAGEKCSV